MSFFGQRSFNNKGFVVISIVIDFDKGHCLEHFPKKCLSDEN